MTSDRIVEIEQQAALHGLDAAIIKAISFAENGPDGDKGAPFGVLPDPGNWNESLRCCCASVRNILCRADLEVSITAIEKGCRGYDRVVLSMDGATYLRDHYAPLGADNDPNGKNANWLHNFYSRYIQLVH